MRVQLTVNGAPATADDVWPGESLMFTGTAITPSQAHA